MNNIEKARDIALKNVEEYHTIDDNGTEYLTHCYNECKKSALEMAEWKDQQMIKYLYKNIQSLLKDYGVSEASADITTQLFLANLKQAMKGE